MRHADLASIVLICALPHYFCYEVFRAKYLIQHVPQTGDLSIIYTDKKRPIIAEQISRHLQAWIHH